ncbi:MAG TPA: DUF3999 family protein [Blastocatellia bacterium]|nr:DUF3999 family protein [Blastocatellia bacterium]
MKLRSLIVGVAVVVFAAMFLSASAQESRGPWPFFVEVTPRARATGLYDLVVPLEVMDKSREDLADLRLYSPQGREIPYALRIRSDIDDKRDVVARVFNEARVGSTTEMSVDLGDSPGEHNEVEIETSGSNFRRRVEVQGSDSAKDWRTLKTGDVIFSFEAQNKTVESKRISYPASRFRYLRVRVSSDELTDKQAPVITEVKVAMARREKGELTTWAVSVPGHQLLRNQGSPASSWTIDLGARVPCDRLALEIDNESFSRPFEIESVEDPQNMRFVAAGELTRRIGEERKPLVVAFENEVYARKLRLVITDYSNELLSITAIKAGAPARQIVFELKESEAQPLRLYFGNSKAIVPHYDFERELPTKLAAQPVRSEVGSITENPDFKPEPQPLTERIPWLIYVVLTVSSLALLMILVSLARVATRGGASARESDTQTSDG